VGQTGQRPVSNATTLTITSDCGGSNGAGVRLWKRELQRFANETGLDVAVTHLPPGTSKWTKIEHRLFAFVTQNGCGNPLVSHQVIVQLIGATTTDTGLKVACEIDGILYSAGIKVPVEEMAALNIERADFHGEWNYTKSPQRPP
jgi:Rhodopirellula transposase DDE domain